MCVWLAGFIVKPSPALASLDCFGPTCEHRVAIPVTGVMSGPFGLPAPFQCLITIAPRADQVSATGTTSCSDFGVIQLVGPNAPNMDVKVDIYREGHFCNSGFESTNTRPFVSATAIDWDCPASLPYHYTAYGTHHFRLQYPIVEANGPCRLDPYDPQNGYYGDMWCFTEASWSKF